MRYTKRYGTSYMRARGTTRRRLGYASKYGRGNRRTGGFSRLLTNRKRRIGRKLVVINPERKFFDGPTGSIGLANTGFIASFFIIPTSGLGIKTGSGASDVVGTHMTVKEIELRLQFYQVEQAENTIANLIVEINTLSVAIILDTQANGALPAMTDIFTGNSPQALRNVENEQRFRFLKEKNFAMNNGNVLNGSAINRAFAADGGNHFICWRLKCNIRIDIQPPGNALSTIKCNNILLVIRSQLSSSTGVGNYHTRVRFIDV